MLTNLTKFKEHYGFSKPYDFSVAVPFLLSLVLFVFVLFIAAFFCATGYLDFGTERFIYFSYLAATLICAAFLARRAKASYVLIALAFMELTLGLATSALSKLDVGFSALPRNVALDLRFNYHPLLQGVPAPNFKIDGPWGEVRHNSMGMRGKEIPGQNVKKVFVYGGSSTYDVGLGEGDTWVEQLNKILGEKYAVVNFGVPGYSTSEHIIQTAFYGDVDGEYPDCAIYYIGWNDIRNAHIPNLDRAYADFHLPSQLGDLETRKVLRIGGFSPLFVITSRTLASLIETASYPKNLDHVIPLQGADEGLEKIFLNNIQTISGINRARNVPTVFIAQILNREKLQADELYGWFPLVKDKDIWELQDRFNNILGEKAKALKDGFVDAGINNFKDSDFIDEGHFNVSGASKFALLISKEVKDHCHFSP